MSIYASRTKTSVEASRAEIERDLKRFKADAFAYMEERRRQLVQFRIEGRIIRLEIEMPTHEQERMTKWRALVLYVRSRLVAVQAGITTLEDAFMSDIVLPDGARLGSWMRPQLALAYEQGSQPKMLPAPDSDRPLLNGRRAV